MMTLRGYCSMNALLLAVLASLGLGSIVSAHDGHGHSPSQSRRSTSPAVRSERPDRDERSRMALQPPHGGQLTRGAYHSFEVVYQPRETRIYLYGPTQHSESAEGVEGQVSMQVAGNPTVFRYPVAYVAAKSGEAGEDYLSIPVDVSRIRDGDMQVTFELVKLPFAQQEPQVRFSQIFALSRRAMSVTIASVSDADRPAITRQAVCPVMGSPLGEHGDVTKMMVGNQPLYLCCEACVEKVQQNPDLYLRQASNVAVRANQTPPASTMMTVAQATDADRAAIAAQRVCPVMNQPLGGHGAPLKVTVNGQSMYLCCRGCLRKVSDNPALYLSKAAEFRVKQ